MIANPFVKLCAFSITVLFSIAVRAESLESPDYELKVKVTRKGHELHTMASFHVPLDKCQAYRFLTDYDASGNIPGVESSKTTRLGEHKARVDLSLKEMILFFPVKMNSVLEFDERPFLGTDFVQTQGHIKTYTGSWRMSPNPTGTTFNYQAVAEPDSALPMFVIQFFIEHRLTESFAAIAKIATERRNKPVQACE